MIAQIALSSPGRSAIQAAAAAAAAALLTQA